MDTADVDAFEYVDEVEAGADPEVDDETDSDGVDAPAVALHVDDGLTERERQVLAFERQWWRRAGAKEQAIRDLFGISSTRYYQLLNGLLDSPSPHSPTTRYWSSGYAACAPPVPVPAPPARRSQPGACVVA